MIEVDGTEYLTPDELANQLGVTRQNVYDWRRSGLVTGVKVRGRLYVRLVEAAAVEVATRKIGRPRAVT